MYLKSAERVERSEVCVWAEMGRGRRARRCVRMGVCRGVRVVRRSCMSFWKRL